MVISRGASSLNSWPHRSAMWQEERTTVWCVCACDNKISRVFSAVRSLGIACFCICSPLGHSLLLHFSAVRLATACFFLRFCCDIALQPSPLPHCTPVRPRVEA